MHTRITLLCIVMALCILLSGCFSEIETITIRTAAEIEEIYYENETMFQAAAEYLVLFGTPEAHFLFVRPIDRGHFEFNSNTQVWLYDLDKIVIDSSVPLSDAQCQDMQTLCAPLIEKLDLPMIVSLCSTVCFVIDTGTGQTAELHYLTPGAEARTDWGVKDEAYINAYWYAAFTSD